MTEVSGSRGPAYQDPTYEELRRRTEEPPWLIAEFTRLMDRLGPFEPSPRVAVGVSGGADSLALCLLLKAWADNRGGSLLALTVDHGLRHDAASEAVQVGSWLKERWHRA